MCGSGDIGRIQGEAMTTQDKIAETMTRTTAEKLNLCREVVRLLNRDIDGLREEVAALREALAPFANRAAEKAAAGKCSPLTESQWNRALEVYQK